MTIQKTAPIRGGGRFQAALTAGVTAILVAATAPSGALASNREVASARDLVKALLSKHTRFDGLFTQVGARLSGSRHRQNARRGGLHIKTAKNMEDALLTVSDKLFALADKADGAGGVKATYHEDNPRKGLKHISFYDNNNKILGRLSIIKTEHKKLFGLLGHHISEDYLLRVRHLPSGDEQAGEPAPKTVTEMFRIENDDAHRLTVGNDGEIKAKPTHRSRGIAVSASNINGKIGDTIIRQETISDRTLWGIGQIARPTIGEVITWKKGKPDGHTTLPAPRVVRYMVGPNGEIEAPHTVNIKGKTNPADVYEQMANDYEGTVTAAARLLPVR